MISKLLKPVINNQKGSPISENGMTGIPFDEDVQKGRITILPPTQDHLGNPVSGATVHYKVYEATGSGLIYTSGSSTEAVTLELPQNTYRVEAYATLLNYENSATRTVKFRFENNVLYVNPASVNGDGSEAAPWPSIAQAIADINDPNRRREIKFTICVEGDLQEDVVIDDSLNVDELEFEKKTGASTAKIKSLTVNGTKTVIVNDMIISNTASSGVGVKLNANTSLTLNRTNITGCSLYGLQLSTAGICNLNESTVNNNGLGIYIASTSAICNLVDTTVTGNSGGVDLKSEFIGSTGSGGTLNVKGNTIINNNGTSNVLLSTNGAGSTVHVTGRLASTARIGVTTTSLPTGTDKLTVTSGYSTYNSIAPGNIFFSDAAYGIMLHGGEAAIALSSGSISNQYEYTVEFKPADGSANFNTSITPGSAKTISVAPVIKHNGTDITSTVSSSELQWYIYVTCHGDTIKSSTSNTITLDAASVNADVYYVTITLTYRGRLYDTQLRLAASSTNQVVFDSYSIEDLKTLIESSENGTEILMKTGVTSSGTAVNIDIPAGRTITLRRAPGYTGALITASSTAKISINNINKTGSGYLVIDGGSADGVTATAPLFIDNFGCDALYKILFRNNNNANGNGGAVMGGNSITTKFFYCGFNNCSAKNGGAGYFNSNVSFENNCTIQDCSATEYGGGLYITTFSGDIEAWITNQTNHASASIMEVSSFFLNCSAGSSGNKIYFNKRNGNLNLNNQNLTDNYPIQ